MYFLLTNARTLLALAALIAVSGVALWLTLPGA
jgi:hypothetical protein